jgi:hypothetical protein
MQTHTITFANLLGIALTIVKTRQSHYKRKPLHRPTGIPKEMQNISKEQWLMRIILHAGAHKTASTFIQHFCASHAAFFAKNGLLYPDTGREILFGHHRLVHAARVPKSAESMRLEFAEALKGHNGDVLISSENFEYLDVESLNKLKYILNTKDFKVIYYVRKWGGMLYSLWQESIKQGGWGTYHEFVLDHVVRPDLSAALNPTLFIEKVMQVFGRNNVEIHAYDLDAITGNILGSFFRSFFSAPLPVPTSTDINTSLDPFSIEQIRLLNFVSKKRKPRYLIRRHYMATRSATELLAIRQELNATMAKHEIELVDKISDSPASVRFWSEFLNGHGDMIVGERDDVLKVMTTPDNPRSIIASGCSMVPSIAANTYKLLKFFNSRIASNIQS